MWLGGDILVLNNYLLAIGMAILGNKMEITLI